MNFVRLMFGRRAQNAGDMTGRRDPSAMHAAADMLEAVGSTGRYSEMRAFRQSVIPGPGECTLDAGVGGQLPGNRCFLNNARDLMTRSCSLNNSRCVVL